jgi:disulfide bond formation protein DsbB
MPSFSNAAHWPRTIGIATLLIAIATWVMDINGWVYPCPYCRTQRTAIGLLGIVLLLPFLHHWAVRWFSAVVASLGIVVAAMQNFNHIKNIFAGTFSLGEGWYLHPFLLSGAALFILTGQFMLIVESKRAT